MSDAPEAADELRGGKVRGDPALKGATSAGREGLGYTSTGDEPDDNSTVLQAEEGGVASGGGT